MSKFHRKIVFRSKSISEILSEEKYDEIRKEIEDDLSSDEYLGMENVHVRAVVDGYHVRAGLKSKLGRVADGNDIADWLDAFSIWILDKYNTKESITIEIVAWDSDISDEQDEIFSSMKLKIHQREIFSKSKSSNLVNTYTMHAYAEWNFTELRFVGKTHIVQSGVDARLSAELFRFHDTYVDQIVMVTRDDDFELAYDVLSSTPDSPPIEVVMMGKGQSATDLLQTKREFKGRGPRRILTQDT